jgi:hypothetical protein
MVPFFAMPFSWICLFGHKWCAEPLGDGDRSESNRGRAGSSAEVPAGRIHNTTIIKLDWRDCVRALFGQSIRTDLRIDWELRDGRMIVVMESAETCSGYTPPGRCCRCGAFRAARVSARVS